MSTSNRRMAALILMLLCGAAVRAQMSEEDVVKVEVGLVTVNVAVTDDRGRYLPEFRAEDFLVTDEGQPVRLEFFDSRGPASIVFVVDISSSMRGEKWQRLRAGLKKFLSAAREANDYTLIAFNESPRLIARSVGADELWRGFNSLEPSGDTALYDAVLLGLETLGQAPRRHKALVLISDGQDNCSRGGLPAVQREALASRATIYAVGIFINQWPLHKHARHGKEVLNDLAEATGGLANFPDPGGIRGVLEQINSDVSSQYTLGYYAPDRTPGWRNIQVSVSEDPRRLKLRYQQRYLVR